MSRALVAVLLSAFVVGAPRAARADESDRRAEVYARLMRAMLAEHRGDYRAAASEIRRAVEALPRSSEVLVQGAMLLQRMGQLADAEALARRALVVEPNHADALLLVADAAAARALRTGSADAESRAQALELYERLLEHGGAEDDEEILRRMVHLRLDSGDRPGALAAAQQLVARHPGDSQAVGLLAQLLLEDGQQPAALETVLRFLAAHADETPLVRVAEELTRDLGAWELVERVFSEATAPPAGRSLDVERLHGEALLRLDRMESASQVLEGLVRREPEDRAIRYHLARTYRRMGRLGEASELARALAAEEPKDARKRLLLAEILDEQGDSAGALEAFVAALEAFDGASAEESAVRDAIRRRLAFLHAAQSQVREARLALAGLEQPEGSESLHAWAKLALAAAEWDEARQHAQKLREHGDDAIAALVEAEGLLREGRTARAAPKVVEAVEGLGNVARVRLADLYSEFGLAAEGEALLRAAVEATPEDAEVHFQLGTFLHRAERIEEAEHELREAFRLDARHSGALNYLGYSLADRDSSRLEEALGLIRQALQVEAWNGAYLDSLGWVLYRMGRYEDARVPLEQAARTFPRDPVVLDHLGDLYLQIGDPQAAIAVWERALDAGSASAAAEALRGKIAVARATAEPGQAAVEADSQDDAGASPF